MRAERLFGAVRALHLAWGLPQALVGAAVYAVVRLHGQGRGPGDGRSLDQRPAACARFRAATVCTWPLDAGLSLGLFVFVPRGCPRRLLVHEYGHCVQSMVLGPLYLPLVVLPSLVWAGVPALRRWRARTGYSYYRFLPERWADRLGERVCGEPAMG